MNALPALGVSATLLRLTNYRLLICIITLLFASAVFLKTYKAPPYYTAYARLLPPQTNTATANSIFDQVGGEASLGAASLSIKSPSDLYASLFFSRTIQQSIISTYKLEQYYKVTDQDSLLHKVSKKTAVSVGKDGIISLSYTDENPELAAKITNSMIEAMYGISQRLARQESLQRNKFYQTLIDQAKKDIDQADQTLSEIEQRTGLTRLKGQEEATSAAVAELRGLIASREVEIAKLKYSMTDYHPEMIALKGELNALKSQLSLLEKGDNQKESSLFVPFDEYIEKKKQIEPARRDVEMKTKALEQLMQVKSLSQVDETRGFSVIQVLDYAVAPTKKSGPRTKINTIAAAIVGFMFAIVLALSWDLTFTDQARRDRWKRLIRSFVNFRFKRSPSING